MREVAALLGIESLLDRAIHRLSGGETQRVALARALAPRPSVLLLDEPFAAVDPATRRMLRRELRLLHERERMTTLQVTHDFDDALRLGDVVAVLSEGRIAQQGRPDEVFRYPNSTFVASFVGTGTVLPGLVTRLVPGSTESPFAARFDSGPISLEVVAEREGQAHAVLRPEDLLLSREAARAPPGTGWPPWSARGTAGARDLRPPGRRTTADGGRDQHQRRRSRPGRRRQRRGDRQGHRHSPCVRRHPMPTSARSLLLLPMLALGASCAREKPEAPLIPPVRQAILTTVGDSASTIEGVALANGMLYVCDWKDGTIYRVDPASPSPVAVGGLPIPPATTVLGMVTDAAGNLYLAVPDPGVVYRVAAARLGATDFDRKKDAVVFATAAKGANGVTFDRAGHLWITGGGTGNLYHVGPAGGAAVLFASNYTAVTTDTTIPVRGYVVNGIAFDSKGGLYTANTGTGEITRIAVGPDYKPGAIGTFVRDPRLIGADGLLMDSPGQPLGGRELPEHPGPHRARRHHHPRGQQHTRRRVHRLHDGARLSAGGRGQRLPVPGGAEDPRQDGVPRQPQFPGRHERGPDLQGRVDRGDHAAMIA